MRRRGGSCGEDKRVSPGQVFQEEENAGRGNPCPFHLEGSVLEDF